MHFIVWNAAVVIATSQLRVCVDCVPLSAPRMRMSIIVTIYLDSMRFRVDTMLTLIHSFFFSFCCSHSNRVDAVEFVHSITAFSSFCGLVCDRMTTAYRDRATVRTFSATLLKLLLRLLFLWCILCIRIFHSFIYSLCNVYDTGDGTFTQMASHSISASVFDVMCIRFLLPLFTLVALPQQHRQIITS